MSQTCSSTGPSRTFSSRSYGSGVIPTAGARTVNSSSSSAPIITGSKFIPSESSTAAAGLGMFKPQQLIPSGYGFVVLTAIGSVGLVTWKAIKVGQAREEHGIAYPTMYSVNNVVFNCIQRAHQNTLENYPQFLMMLLIGGLEMPYFSTLGGIIWICGRIAYAQGYYTGDPRRRAQGTFGIIGSLMIGLATLKFALRNLF